MDFLKKIFGMSNEGSGAKAKDRLRIVLIHDRTDISPQLLDSLRDEKAVALVANIPVLRIKRGNVDVNAD